jgi:hypothetical protein
LVDTRRPNGQLQRLGSAEQEVDHGGGWLVEQVAEQLPEKASASWQPIGDHSWYLANQAGDFPTLDGGVENPAVPLGHGQPFNAQHRRVLVFREANLNPADAERIACDGVGAVLGQSGLTGDEQE